jgi:hypothetical protein
VIPGVINTDKVFGTHRFDSLTEERIKAMIAELEQRKEAMH